MLTFYFCVLLVLLFGYLDGTELSTQSQVCKTISCHLSYSKATSEIAYQQFMVCLFW